MPKKVTKMPNEGGKVSDPAEKGTVLGNSAATSTEASAETAPNMDSYLKSLESGSKPWFLSSATVYRIIEEAVIAAPMSSTLLNRAVVCVSTLTEFFNEKTKSKVPVVDIDKAQEFLQRLDGLLSDFVIRVDDGIDKTRAKLAVSLRQLVASISAHSLMIKQTCADKIEVVTKATGDGIIAVKTQAAGRFEQAKTLLESVLENMRARYPDAYDRISSLTSACSPATCTSLVQSSVDGAKQRALETSTATTALVLKTAQPYVHNAYSGLVGAVESSHPYIERAKPYVDPYYEPYVLPLVSRAESTFGTLQENEMVGPYVKSAVGVAWSALEAAKTYCVAENGTEESAPAAGSVPKVLVPAGSVPKVEVTAGSAPIVA